MKVKINIRLNKFMSWRERVVTGIYHLAALVDTVVYFATLSFYTPELRSVVLWADWADKFMDKGDTI